MFDFLGRMAAAHPGKIVCAWIALAFALTTIAPDWKTQSQDDDVRSLPASYPSIRGYQLLEQAFPKDVSVCKATIAIEREGRPLSRSDFALVDQVVGRINQLREERPSLPITAVTSYKDGPVGSRLIAADQRCTLVQVSLTSPYLALQTRDAVDAIDRAIQPILTDAGSSAPQVLITGPAGIGRDLTNASARSLDQTTWATVLLVVIVLLLVYRSPLLALVPLFTIGVATWVSLQMLALATLIPGVHVANVSQIFCIVILFGAGTDYCLFLISRYREELEHGRPAAGAASSSVRAVGGALAASAATVVCGLGMMGFAEFGKIRSAGPVIAIGLVVGLLASLTLAPALLRIGGKGIFWPQRIRLLEAASSRKVWNRISFFVVRKPYLVLLAALIPLVGLAFLGLRVKPSYRPTGDLSASSGSVRGLGVVQEHFTAGETGPITVLLASRTDWTSREGKEVLAELSMGFGYLPNVAEVRSATQPLGKSSSNQPAPASSDKKLDLRNLLTRAKSNLGSALDGLTSLAAEPYYLARTQDQTGPLFVTRIDVVLNSDPFDATSRETLDLIEMWLRDVLPDQTSLIGAVRAETVGITVYGRDMEKVVSRDRIRVNVLVSIGVFLILLVLVRQVWLAGYLLGTVLLSYLATLGLTALFTMWLTGRPFGVIEWRVPFFLFTILVAVGEDYNILLVSRILQERKRHGMVEGLRRGLAATGGTITACGVIMAGTFGTLMLADLSTLKQIGFALAAGVLLDTLVVRPLLVPAFLLIVWQDQEKTAPQRQHPPIPLRRAA